MQFATIAVIAGPLLIPSAEWQIGTVRTRVDLVLVPASVRDSRGNLVSDLKPEEFQLFEDAKPQMLTDASIDTMPPAVEVVRDRGLTIGPFAAVHRFVHCGIQRSRPRRYRRVGRS
jgi:hypothetical protein